MLELSAAGLAQFETLGGHRQRALLAHGVAGVDRQVQQQAADLGWIAQNQRASGIEPPRHVDVPPQGLLQNVQRFAEDFVQVEQLSLRRALAGEVEQLLGEIRRALRIRTQHIRIPSQLGGRKTALLDAVHEEEHTGQLVVELMGHAAGKLAKGAHAFGALQAQL